MQSGQKGEGRGRERTFASERKKWRHVNENPEASSLRRFAMVLFRSPNQNQCIRKTNLFADGLDEYNYQERQYNYTERQLTVDQLPTKQLQTNTTRHKLSFIYGYNTTPQFAFEILLRRFTPAAGPPSPASSGSAVPVLESASLDRWIATRDRDWSLPHPFQDQDAQEVPFHVPLQELQQELQRQPLQVAVPLHQLQASLQELQEEVEGLW